MRGKKAKVIRRVVREAERKALLRFVEAEPDGVVPDADKLRAYRKAAGKIIKRNIK